MAVIRRHPSRSKLEAWLTGADDPRIEEHLETCARCAAVCEDLEAPGVESALSNALRDVLAPPSDLVPRLETRVAERLNSRQLADYVFDLFAAGLDTGRLLLAGPETFLVGGADVESTDGGGQTDDGRPDADRDTDTDR